MGVGRECGNLLGERESSPKEGPIFEVLMAVMVIVVVHFESTGDDDYSYYAPTVGFDPAPVSISKPRLTQEIIVFPSASTTDPGREAWCGFR